MTRCMFLKSNGCAILKVTQCPTNCSFCKTKAEFEEAQKEAERMLERKGLESYQKRLENGDLIMTTRKVWWMR